MVVPAPSSRNIKHLREENYKSKRPCGFLSSRLSSPLCRSSIDELREVVSRRIFKITMTRSALSWFLLVTIAVGFCQAQQDEYQQSGDIFFPGAADRPSKYPLDPNGSQRTTRRPGNTTPTPVSTTPNERLYTQCLDRCRATSEYNPVCGTDNVQYSNPGRLSCAKTCGRSIEIRNYGSCNTDGVRG